MKKESTRKLSRIKPRERANNLIWRQFISFIRDLDGDDGVVNFLNNFFTPSERKMVAKRLAIVILLEQGLTYREIIKHIKVSQGTINRMRNIAADESGAYKEIASRIVDNKKGLSKGQILIEVEAFLSTFPRMTGGGRWRF